MGSYRPWDGGERTVRGCHADSRDKTVLCLEEAPLVPSEKENQAGAADMTITILLSSACRVRSLVA
ncbi:hypothetical protein E2C01_073215 [Portunus trituberculatus]|uniref:Uncharacterized protein n=1 Tax=Portunus trituberculatus TaxID=210409 RepID=A0A5B7ICR2_PORTR|nr:hypothetical protein [Portunus trituberculatus]